MFVLMELSHGTVIRRFDDRGEAMAALERIGAVADNEDHFAVVECDENGAPTGELHKLASSAQPLFSAR